jgi:hypothetical protein
MLTCVWYLEVEESKKVTFCWLFRQTKQYLSRFHVASSSAQFLEAFYIKQYVMTACQLTVPVYYPEVIFWKFTFAK